MSSAAPKAILKPPNKGLMKSKEVVGLTNTVRIPPTKTYKFRVSMWCEGCALDVKQALESSKGPKSVVDYNIDYSTKRVSISSPLPLDEVFKILTKAGKDATLEETGGDSTRK